METMYVQVPMNANTIPIIHNDTIRWNADGSEIKSITKLAAGSPSIGIEQITIAM